MLKSNMLLSSYLLLVYFLGFSSCVHHDEKLKFKQFNNIVNESIKYSLDSNCFDYSKYEASKKKKVFGLVVNPMDSIKLDTNIRFVNFNIKKFFENSENANFSNDTLEISIQSEHKVYLAYLREFIDFSEYHRQFNEKDLYDEGFTFIKTILVINPRIKYDLSSNQILLELDRDFEYFENVNDRTYLLITTDKEFNIKRIDCLEKKFPIMPMAPWEFYESQDSVYHDW